VSTATPVEAESTPAAAPRKKRKIGLDKFDLVKVIGKGSFGTVLLVKKKDNGEWCAVNCGIARMARGDWSCASVQANRLP
jgi:hypothetical protein